MTDLKTLLRILPSTRSEVAVPIAIERVISGTPAQITENLFTNSQGNFFCGVWSSDSGKWHLNYTEDEFCYLIKGSAIITDQLGHAETVNGGDAFVIPAGFKGTWETLGAAQKFYAIYEAAGVSGEPVTVTENS